MEISTFLICFLVQLKLSLIESPPVVELASPFLGLTNSGKTLKASAARSLKSNLLPRRVSHPQMKFMFSAVGVNIIDTFPRATCGWKWKWHRQWKWKVYISNKLDLSMRCVRLLVREKKRQKRINWESVACCDNRITSNLLWRESGKADYKLRALKGIPSHNQFFRQAGRQAGESRRQVVTTRTFIKNECFSYMKMFSDSIRQPAADV